MSLPNKVGVYKITNSVDGKFYVGSALFSIRVRCRTHRARLRANKHPNKHLQRAWNKYGEHSFKFSVVEICDYKECLVREQYWLDLLKPYDRKLGYNKSNLATGVAGIKWTAEQRARLSASLRALNRKLTPEEIKHRSSKQRGLKRSDETKARMSESAKRRGISDETRAKINAALKSEEVRAKLARANLGKKASAEARANMSLAQRRRFARQRGENYEPEGQAKHCAKTLFD